MKPKTKRPAGGHPAVIPIRSVGVVFVAPRAGRDTTQCPADTEVLETACAVQAALQRAGLSAALVRLEPDGFDHLHAFDWIFNLTETVRHFPLTDYQIAAEMERRGIRYTGSGPAALHACLDKAITKARLGLAGLRTPPFEVYSPGVPSAPTRLRFPVLVKPAREDGSIGIDAGSLLWDQERLAERIAYVHAVYDQPALVEEYISGQDMTAAILGNGALAACLPLSVMQYDCSDPYPFLTFESKWVPESEAYRQSRGVCPPDLDPVLRDPVNALALAAYRMMGCRDYASVDFRVQAGVAHILEVNPNPCINPHGAGYVRAARAAAYGYDDLVCRLLDISIQNYNHAAWRKTGAERGYFLEALVPQRSAGFGEDAGPYSGL